MSARAKASCWRRIVREPVLLGHGGDEEGFGHAGGGVFLGEVGQEGVVAGGVFAGDDEVGRDGGGLYSVSTFRYVYGTG